MTCTHSKSKECPQGIKVAEFWERVFRQIGQRDSVEELEFVLNTCRLERLGAWEAIVLRTKWVLL
jgi:hypothetical protein